MIDDEVPGLPGERARQVTRRGFLLTAGSASSVLLVAACGGATAPQAASTAAPSKPAEAAKPTEAPSKPAVPAAPVASPGASPVAGASPAASPAAQAAPASQVAGALPNLRGVSLTVLAPSNFIPQLDPFFKKQIEDDFVKQTGAQVSFETIAQNDIGTRIAAAVQNNSGPDLIMQAHNWAHLYANNLADVSDVVADVKKITGDFYPQVEAQTNVGGRYRTVPHDCLGIATLWRKSMFQQIGLSQLPATFDEWHMAGKKLKDNGHPLGQCLGHSINDPNNWCYTMMWDYGGREVDEQGKVAINSPETIAAVKAMKDNWGPAYDETGLSWDDSGNNRAFLAEAISATQNGASIWWVAKNQDKKPWLDDIGLGPMLAGPKGKVTTGVDWSYGVMGYGKNIDAAKAFLRWAMSDAVWMPWFEVAEGFSNGVGPQHDAKAPWSKLAPAVQILKDAQVGARAIGWPGPPNQKAALALAKFIVVDMFAKAVQGDSPESAVAWAEGELKQIYT